MIKQAIGRSTVTVEASRCRKWSTFSKMQLPGLQARGAVIKYTAAAVEYVMANPEVAEQVAQLAVKMQLAQPSLEGNEAEQLKIDFEGSAG